MPQHTKAFQSALMPRPQPRQLARPAARSVSRPHRLHLGPIEARGPCGSGRCRATWPAATPHKLFRSEAMRRLLRLLATRRTRRLRRGSLAINVFVGRPADGEGREYSLASRATGHGCAVQRARRATHRSKSSSSCCTAGEALLPPAGPVDPLPAPLPSFVGQCTPSPSGPGP